MKRSTHFASINALVRRLLTFQLWTYTLVLPVGLFGCATPPIHLTPVLDRPNMDKIYFEGRALALSFGEKSSVAVSGTIDGDELILLMLCISHTERIDVIPENIRILGYGANNQGVALKVYPPPEYMAKKRNAQNWSLVLQALSGALDAQQAGRSTSTTYGSNGGKSFYGRTETNDREAADRALAKHKEELRRTVESYARSNAATESGLLKANTIFYNQAVGGIVIAKLLKPISVSAVNMSPILHSESRETTFGVVGTVPLGRKNPLSYSKVVIIVPWIEEEPHQITLIR
jgi:hypothetical protein